LEFRRVLFRSHNQWIAEKLNDQVIKEKKTNRKQWIAEKWNGQATKVGIRIFASFLVALSGLMLFTDKITTFGITSSFGFQDTQTFNWAPAQPFSPFVLISGIC